ncbi:rod shape-determining protein MreD [Jannaschia sp. LMIT008]|uniref:rod shape-determining protein MreD n=1 Tax=Jannaschia maritima TaxID=3032585 RepID=UPI002811524A|nr:rod shape-determining protein MreD [Jannaschia sp. LMIT008]
MAPRTVWAFRALFGALATAILFFALLPFGPGEGGIPGPDLMLCLVIAWVLRRPDYVPLWLLLPLLLLDDALLMRPLGLWTLTVVLVTEWLRRRVDHGEALPWSTETALAVGCIAVAFAANQLALSLLLVPAPPPLGGQAIHAVATMLFYWPVAIVSRLLGVRRLAPGELDTMGARA